MAIVVEAVFRIGRRAIVNRAMLLIAILAFAAILFLQVPFPWIVFSAAIAGYLLGRYMPELFPEAPDLEDESEDEIIVTSVGASHRQPSIRRAILIIAVCLTLWFGPIAILAQNLGADNIFVNIGVFFSKTAVVTFGGAYAVLAYIAQQAVEVFGWLQPGQMLDGLGMAETTPGPLIQVVQFVGFMGAYQNSGALSPLMAGLYASILTTWVTFVPCFLWIFLGAPYVERLRGNRSLSSGLAAITAAVVGVVLNLALWFSLQTLFTSVSEIYWGPLRLLVPDLSTLDWASLLIALAAFIALFRYKVSMIKTLLASASVGFAYYLLFLS
jgi:chromate transporter